MINDNIPLIKNLTTNKDLAIVVITGVILTLLLPVFTPIILLLVPAVFLFDFSRRSFLLLLPIVAGVGFLNTILMVVVIDLIGVSLSPQIVVATIAVQALVLLAVKPRKLSITLPVDSYRLALVLYLLFIAALIGRVWSVFNQAVPILHDPISHAFWSQSIDIDRGIDYFYSPGLHIWSWLTSSSFDISHARSTHLVTNVVSAAAVPLWGLVAYIFTKQSRIAVAASLVVLVSPFPQFLYVLAGKNALITAFTLTSLALLSAELVRRNQSYIRLVLMFVVITGIGLIHYPTYPYVIIAVSSYLVLSGFSKQRHAGEGFRKSLIKQSSQLIPVYLSVAFILIFAFVTFNVAGNASRPIGNSIGRKYHSASMDILKPPENLEKFETKSNTRKLVKINNPKNALEGTYNQIVSLADKVPKDAGLLFLGASLMAAYMAVSTRETSTSIRRYKQAVIIFPIAAVILSYLLSVFSVWRLGTTMSAGLFILLSVIGFPIAIIVGRAKGLHRYAEAVLFIIIVVSSTYFTFNAFSSASKHPFVDENDVAAFQWIGDHIDRQEGFIGMSRLDPSRQAIVFGIDATIWIPVFTNNKVATPFHGQQFSRRENQINYEYTRRLRSKNMEIVKDAIEYFTSNGYPYLYVDGEPGYADLGVEALLSSNLGRIVYSAQSVMIVRIGDTNIQTDE